MLVWRLDSGAALADNAPSGNALRSSPTGKALKVVNAGKVHTVVGPKDPAGAG
jgi:hypothetical protein